MLVTLIADVANSYVNIRTLEDRLRVARRNLELQQESLRLGWCEWVAGLYAACGRRIPRPAHSLSQQGSAVPDFAYLFTESPNQQVNAASAPLGGWAPGRRGRTSQNGHE